jgi:hypothetical protein
MDDRRDLASNALEQVPRVGLGRPGRAIAMRWPPSSMLTPSGHHEIHTRPARDTRQQRRGRRAPDCLVQECGSQTEPNPAEQARRYGAEMSI